MSDSTNAPHSSVSEAPHPGSKDMPRWNSGELPDAPRFTWRHWTMLLGPGLLMGGAAIGGGEWLTGPIVTAKYGGAMLWLATLSILGQVVYNLEISRYTLYTGEPIFTGKFRTPPGPMVWVGLYLLLDFGSVFPYLAASAATPLYTAINGALPDPANNPADGDTLRYIAYGIFLGAMIPLVFGGKIYNSLRSVMAFKVVVVMGFLLFVGVFYSTPATWWEIGSGFFEFGNIPITAAEDRNGNGQLDPGEDWDSDGHLDVVEPSISYEVGYVKLGEQRIIQHGDDPRTPETASDWEQTIVGLRIEGASGDVFELKDDALLRGTDSIEFAISVTRGGEPQGPFTLDRSSVFGPSATRPRYLDLDGDGTRDGDNVDNVITAALAGRELPPINWSLIAFLSALVAISGSGGLSNMPVSNYTRDQGWGMGHHVGAIPSMVGGNEVTLSHVGIVFEVTEESLPKWKRWYHHIRRDQLAVWMPACFFGLALPSMLSVQFLARGTETNNKWEASVMTAGALEEAVGGGTYGHAFWFMTLLCGFLVLAPTMAVTADGVIRRWVDAFWTASLRLRQLPTSSIRYVYFTVLVIYAIFGMVMLSLQQPETLLLAATTIFNFALGLSCWHVLWVNHLLLPKPLRPGWFMSLSLFSAGVFFLFVATVSTLQRFVWN